MTHTNTIAAHRCSVRPLGGGQSSADLEDAIACAVGKLETLAGMRDEALHGLHIIGESIKYQRDTKANYEARLKALLEPGTLCRGSDLRRKMLDDLAAQRAAITRKIKDLEAEVAS